MDCKVQFLRLLVRSSSPWTQPRYQQLQLLRNYYSRFKVEPYSPKPNKYSLIIKRRFVSDSTKPQQNGPSPNNQSRQQDIQTKSKLSLLWTTIMQILKKFRTMLKEYWYILLPVHFTTSAVWLGAIYFFTKDGVRLPFELKGIDFGYYLKALGFSETLVNKITSSVGHLAVAYTLFKLVTPVRLAVTLGCSNYAINVLRSKGYISKPVQVAQEIYNKSKENVSMLSQAIKKK